jgi:predicted dinucleotide-binding enzyme
MNITVIGRGNVGGGLARRWERAGHNVTALGRDGGDAAGADAVLVAVPSNAISDALGKVPASATRSSSTQRTRSTAATRSSSRSRTR